MKLWMWLSISVVAVTGLASNARAEDAHAAAQVLNVGGVPGGAGGTVKGVVKFEGKQVARKAIDMAADKFCTDSHSTPVLDERWVFGDNNTLQNVFVYVASGLEGKTVSAPADRKPEIDQVGCVYVPRVMGMIAGEELIILNGDNTLHNVNMKSTDNGNFNIGMPVKGMVEKRKFAKPEMGLTFKCDVHPWMGAYVHVLPHPFFAVTQKDGSFTIQGLPAGEYELKTWHEFSRFGPDAESYKVTVTEGGAAEVTITYAPKKQAQ